MVVSAKKSRVSERKNTQISKNNQWFAIKKASIHKEK